MWMIRICYKTNSDRVRNQCEEYKEEFPQYSSLKQDSKSHEELYRIVGEGSTPEITYSWKIADLNPKVEELGKDFEQY